MQATGQYGVPDVPQYVGSRVAPSHGHNMFNEMSLSPSSGHSHGHGHGLSLSHSPHTQQQQQQQNHQQQQLNHSHLQQQVMSQHHQQQPQFIQSHQPSQSHQQAQHGFGMSMNVPKAPPPLPQHQPQQSQVLQSAQQQVQADNHHQHPHHQQQQQQQQADHVQLRHQVNQQATILQQQQQSSLEPDSSPPQALNPGLNKGLVTREESLDGEEQDVLGEEGEKGGAGNRWPRPEALALLKIRSEMDAVFRDSSLKGPLWEEISRKLAEMGYHRSAKKCKEKFENVHKYYKRTKDGKAGRPDGKNYRFFSQLEALYGKAGHGNNALNLSNKSLNSSTPAGLIPSANINGDNGGVGLGLIAASRNTNKPALPSTDTPTAAAAATTAQYIARTLERVESITDNSSGFDFSFESSEDDEFDDAGEGGTENLSGKKRKRKSMKKYLVFFEKVMKKVLDKQEQMQQKLLEALERRDQDRMIREEAWKRQEVARLNREHDLRAQERALLVSRDTSLIAFLQKVTGQQTLTLPLIAMHSNHQPPSATIPADYIQDDSPHDKEMYDPTIKRWPKPEVLALIKLRTILDKKFHEPGSKSVLWEEISAGMSSQGFSRTPKRCKEKWENINKYFKKAKDSNKKRPENAKTCPYFHHLNALYKEGLLGGGGSSITSNKQLRMIEKGEVQSEDVLEQGNKRNTREDSGQAQEGDSEILPAGEIEGPGLNATPIAAAATASINLTTAPSTTSASNDAAMHLFMSSDNRDNNASTKKVMPSKDSPPTTNSASANHPATTNSLPLNLEGKLSSKS